MPMTPPLCVLRVAVACASLAAHGTSAGAPETARTPRVRWENRLIARAIAEGLERSTTFRSVIDAINATDGVVYVLEGKCGQGVRACLHMSVEASGENRLLRILVDPRRAPGCELIEAIGHELQHALEALRNPRIRNGFAMSSFFHQIGPEGPRRFETPEAERIGSAVGREACRKNRLKGATSPIPAP
jgi:hypothetical protein